MDLDVIYETPPTAIQQAAKDGDVISLKNLLKSGARPDATDHRGWTALHHAAANNKFGCVEILLDHPFISRSQRTHSQDSVLKIAVKFSASADVVKVILDKQGNDGVNDVLHFACYNGSLEVVKVLVDSGCSINNQEHLNGQTPLHRAIEGKHAPVVEYLVSKGACLNVADENDVRPLFEAVLKRSVSCAEILLKANVNTEERDLEGITPLMLASQMKDLDMMNLLLKYGADPNAVDCRNAMAITYAIHEGFLDGVKKLLPLLDKTIVNSLPKRKSAGRSIPLFCAAIDAECKDCLDCLINANFDDVVKCWALQDTEYPFYEFAPAISFLLDMKIPDYKEDTFRILKTLIDHGFPVNARTANELPPLVAASRNKDCFAKEILEELIKAGANVAYRSHIEDIPDAIYFACINNNSLALQVFLQHSVVSPYEILQYFIIKNRVKVYDFIMELNYVKDDDFTGLDKKMYEMVEEGHTEWLERINLLHSQLPSLQAICRQKVRKELRQESASKFLANIESLPLPRTIISYLKFN